MKQLKRSEAIAKIKSHFFRETETQADMQAELMLQFFEKELGMQPIRDIPESDLPTPEMRERYQQLAKQMKGWLQEPTDPESDKNWAEFERDLKRDKL